jgi:uncharacterized delta-60 repeat protein
MNVKWMCLLALSSGLLSSRSMAGTIDPLFEFPTNFSPTSTSILQIDPTSQGKFYASGLYGIADTQLNRIFRFNQNGSWDTDFSLGSFQGGIGYFIEYPDESGIIVTGGFTFVQGFAVGHVARFFPDGTLDRSFRTPDLCGVIATRFATNGNIYVYGRVDVPVEGVVYKGVVRLTSEGSVDPTFFVNLSGGLGSVLHLEVQQDGKVIILGNFTAVDGVPVPGFARLRSTGALDFGYHPPNLDVFDRQTARGGMMLQADGKLLIWRTIRINGRKYDLLRLNTNGTLDETFQQPTLFRDYNPNQEFLIDTVCFYGTNRIIIGGSFTHVSGHKRHGIARLQMNGLFEDCFAPEFSDAFAPTPLNTSVLWVSCVEDGSIFAAGRIRGQTTERKVVRLLGGAAQAPSLAVPHFEPAGFCAVLNTFPGQSTVVHVSSDLQTWYPILTNLAENCEEYFCDPQAEPSSLSRFYKATASP